MKLLARYGTPSRAASWQKASFCAGGECVEVAPASGAVLVRSTADPRTVIRYSLEEWQAFVMGVQAGEFDDLPRRASALR